MSEKLYFSKLKLRDSIMESLGPDVEKGVFFGYDGFVVFLKISHS